MSSDPVFPPNSLPTESVKPAQQQGTWPAALRRQPPWVRYGLLGTAGALLIVGSVAGVQSLTSSPPEVKPAASRVLPVETVEIKPVSSYQVPRIYTGEIAALRSSDLGFERGGELVEVLVNEGERVQAGEPLARLDIRNLETQRLQVAAQKAQAEAQLAELENGARPEEIAAAEAEVRDLEQQLILQETQERRRENLYAEGAISREQLDEFSFGANSLQARLDQARSRLEELLNGTRSEQVQAQRAVVNQLQAQLQDIDVNISKSTVTAPFDGIIAERSVDEGTVVNTGQAVIELIESATPEARIGIPADVVNQLEVGIVQAVRVNNQSYQAKVDAILPQVDAATRTQKVVLTLSPTAVGEVEPGQTARLTINEAIQADGYWLPTDALTHGIRGLWTCYVLVPADMNSETPEDSENDATFTDTSRQFTNGANGRPLVVEQRSVEIIHQESVSEGNAAETRALVRGTLQPGEQVVIGGVHRLVNGQAVRPLPSE
ncbi:MAG: HlyD family efflux transporter periplasmic adaptor subunit [Cyanobacteria bacterium P01_G01_bin.38]